jgi:hypothetical protein
MSNKEPGATDRHRERAWRFALALEHQILHAPAQAEEKGIKDRRLGHERETPSPFMMLR